MPVSMSRADSTGDCPVRPDPLDAGLQSGMRRAIPVLLAAASVVVVH